MNVLEELKKREPIFHRPEFGTTHIDFENMTIDGYWEIGASGKRNDLASCRQAVENTVSPRNNYYLRAIHYYQYAQKETLPVFFDRAELVLVHYAGLKKRWNMFYLKGLILLAVVIAFISIASRKENCNI